MLLVLSGTEDMPVYEQIADAVKQQLFDGKLNHGDELPPVRILAEALGVNMHTVRHAYRQLADEGIITMRLGRRTRICSRPANMLPNKEFQSFLLEKWRRLERDAYLAGGLSGEQLLAFISLYLNKGITEHV